MVVVAHVLTTDCSIPSPVIPINNNNNNNNNNNKNNNTRQNKGVVSGVPYGIERDCDVDVKRMSVARGCFDRA